MKDLIMPLVLVVLMLASSPAWAQRPGVGPDRQATPIPGRFQLVSQDQGTMFLIDTATGRVWRYTALTGTDDKERLYPCTIGLVTCFIEIDRVRTVGEKSISDITGTERRMGRE